MDKIKPSCAALLRRRRRGFNPAQEDNAQDPAAGDHHEMDPIPVAEPDIEQPAAPEPEDEAAGEPENDEADSVFKYSVYEDGQDPLGYEIGKMISQARKVWQVKINVSPTEWDWRWSNEFEEAFSGRYQQGYEACPRASFRSGGMTLAFLSHTPTSLFVKVYLTFPFIKEATPYSRYYGL